MSNNLPASQAFFSRLAGSNEHRDSRLCVGIDPLSGDENSFLMDQLQQLGPRRFLVNYATAHINAAKGRVSAVKFQSAFFEVFGGDGFAALKEGALRARKEGLLSILDAKRGDIASTMFAYGKMAFEEIGADCLTVLPYMGSDVIKPLLPWLKSGRGIYIVWMSSNPSASELQDLPVQAGHQTVAGVLAEQVGAFADHHEIRDGIGLVLGATRLEGLSRQLEASAGRFPLLMPGLGAQGAQPTKPLADFLNSHSSHLAPISRGLSVNPAAQPLQSWDDYRELITKNLTDFQDTLRTAQ